MRRITLAASCDILGGFPGEECVISCCLSSKYAFSKWMYYYLYVEKASTYTSDYK